MQALAKIKTLIKDSFTWPGWVGWVLTLLKPLDKGLSMLGDVDLLANYGGVIGRFLDTGTGYFVSILFGGGIIGYAIYRRGNIIHVKDNGQPDGALETNASPLKEVPLSNTSNASFKLLKIVPNGTDKLFRITDRSEVFLRLFQDTGPTKRADALLLIIYGYKLLLGIDSVKLRVANLAVNEALGTAPNSPVPLFLNPIFQSGLGYDHDYGLEYVNCGFLEATGLSKGGFYRLTREGESRAEQLAKDLISRA
jgi:hypothetical protein